MRHIPEDELHAYLDQGLSRSQCVEIESHLAGCSSCRGLRDGIAALRDRTTALLAELAPPRGFPPAFEVIRHRAAQRVSTRRRRVRAAAWAASLVAAVGVGWSASTMLRIAPGPTIAAGTTRSVAEAAPATVRLPRPTGAASSTLVSSPDPSPAAPSPAPAPARERREAPAIAARDNSPASAAARLASHTLRDDSIRAAKLAVLDPSPAVELPPLQVAQSEGGRQFGGMWRTMSWAGAQSEAGTEPAAHRRTARTPGAGPGERPGPAAVDGGGPAARVGSGDSDDRRTRERCLAAPLAAHRHLGQLAPSRSR